MKNQDFFTTYGSKKIAHEHTVLNSYVMNINDILTKWILNMYSMQEKCVPVLYSSINNSKNHAKCTKPIDWTGQIRTVCLLCTRITLETTALRVKWAQAMDSMGRIRTAYLLCTRITLETTALRVTWKLRSRRSGVFPEVQVCGFECFQGSKRVFRISRKSRFFTTYGSKKIVHEPNPLTAPYSAHILWKLMIFWPNESSKRVLCRKNVYRSCTDQ